jgi:hypothetical protein
LLCKYKIHGKVPSISAIYSKQKEYLTNVNK